MGLLREAEIETSTKYDLFDAIDCDLSGELSFREVVEGLLKLRGPITKSDIVAVRLKVRWMIDKVASIDECSRYLLSMSCSLPNGPCPRVILPNGPSELLALESCSRNLANGQNGASRAPEGASGFW